MARKTWQRESDDTESEKKEYDDKKCKLRNSGDREYYDTVTDAREYRDRQSEKKI